MNGIAQRDWGCTVVEGLSLPDEGQELPEQEGILVLSTRNHGCVAPCGTIDIPKISAKEKSSGVEIDHCSGWKYNFGIKITIMQL